MPRVNKSPCLCPGALCAFWHPPSILRHGVDNSAIVFASYMHIASRSAEDKNLESS